MIWLVSAAYLLGWLLAIRPALQARMRKVVCQRCDLDRSTESHAFHDLDLHWQDPAPVAPRGSLREREGRDVAVAILVAAFWPLKLAWFIFAASMRALGGGVKAVVTRATPLTAPELERRIREQQAEIKRLSEQMNDAREAP